MSLLSRLGGGGNVLRFVFGAFGLAGFVLGAIVAWRSASATTLLVVSAVLLVLGALGLDWNKIRGTYGGWTLELLRDLGDRIDQVAENAASEQVTPEIQKELDSLRAEVKALTPPPPPRSRRLALGPTVDMNAILRELATTRATHSFRGTDAAQLSLRIVSSQDARYRCTVKTPTGKAFDAVTRRPSTPSLVGAPTYTVVYPDEFEGSEPLIPGRYEVEWRSAPLRDPVGENVLATALAQLAIRPVATDSFTIPQTSTLPPSPTA